jgi:hypothetical protein
MDIQWPAGSQAQLAAILCEPDGWQTRWRCLRLLVPTRDGDALVWSLEFAALEKGLILVVGSTGDRHWLRPVPGTVTLLAVAPLQSLLIFDVLVCATCGEDADFARLAESAVVAKQQATHQEICC